MARALEEETVTANMPTKYAAACVPVGTQRALGYLVWVMSHIHAALIRGDVARARLLAVGGVMMAEQSTLDANWKTAWRLMGLESPPWHEWSTMDINGLKREYSKSRLADNKWIAAVIADLRDEDFLMKRRGNGGKGPGKGQDDQTH